MSNLSKAFTGLAMVAAGAIHNGQPVHAQSCDPDVSSFLDTSFSRLGFNVEFGGATHDTSLKGVIFNNGSVTLDQVTLRLTNLRTGDMLVNSDATIPIPAPGVLHFTFFFNYLDNPGFEFSDPHQLLLFDHNECNLDDNEDVVFYDDTIRGPTLDVNNCDWTDGGFEAIPGFLLPPPGGGDVDVCDLPINPTSPLPPQGVAVDEKGNFSVVTAIDVVVNSVDSHYTSALTTEHYSGGVLSELQRQTFDPSGQVMSDTIYYMDKTGKALSKEVTQYDSGGNVKSSVHTDLSNPESKTVKKNLERTKDGARGKGFSWNAGDNILTVRRPRSLIPA